MTRQLEHKRIVIIGSTTGLGLSAAKAFIREGAQVVGVGRSEESVRGAQEVLGNDAILLQGDAAHPDTARMAIDTCIRKFGGFHGLYHVAGASGRKAGDGPLHELTLDGWHKTMDVNLTSMMLSNQSAIRTWQTGNQGGSILNMGSALALAASPEYFATHAYATAKSAIEGFTRAVAAYYAPFNIRINAVAPGLVDTPMAQRATGDEVIRAYVHTKQPLDGGRIGLPEDLDGIAVYFMSDASRFTTGQLVAVDGGWSISEGQKETNSARGKN